MANKVSLMKEVSTLRFMRNRAKPVNEGVSAKAVGMAIGLIFLSVWWIVYSEMRTQVTEITSTSLPMGVIFLLFLLCFGNALIARYFGKNLLSGPELAIIYTLTAVGSSLAGIGMVGFMMPALANPFYYNNATNHWAKLANPAPWFWAPHDPQAIRAFYLGNSTLYTWEHLQAWLAPVLYWGLFFMVLLGFFLCVALLLRRQWIEQERLSYPIIVLPMEMTLYPDGFFGFLRQRGLLIGFLIPVVLQTINSLNYLFPSVPYIPVKPTINGPLDLGPLFTTPPWNALGYFPLAFHPNTIGLAYLLPADVSFSCWFFYLVRKGLDVFCTAMGWRSPQSSPVVNRIPYSPEQGVGAWIAMAIMVLWLARRELKRYGAAAFRFRGCHDKEAASLRWAVWGALVSFGGMVYLIGIGGMPITLVLVMLLVVIAYLLALTRIRVDAGTAWHFGPFIPAQEVVANWVGPATLSPASVSTLAFHEWYNLDYRSMTVPHLFEGYRMAYAGRSSARRLTWAMFLCMLVGYFVACWASLQLYYTYGAATAHVNPWRIQMGQIPWNLAQAHQQSLQHYPDWPGIEGMVAGALITFLLFYTRSQFTWWPFHPAGYAIGNTFITDLLWCPFLVGWLAKVLILRYGGMQSYRRALPFFIGLILGDYVIACLWSLAGVAFHMSMYRCFPN